MVQQFPLLTLFVVVVVVLLILSIVKSRRAEKGMCKRCRAVLPQRARFCSRCGSKQ